MIRRSLRRRKLVDRVVRVLSGLAAAAGIAALAWILWVVLDRGAAAINWDLFTKAVTPPGVAGGGVGNALLGSAMLVGVAILFGVPVGILAGVYLAEFGRDSRFGAAVRFSSNVMMGVPSIIVGLFVFALIVAPMQHYSGWAGSVALAILMTPVVARTTEDMLALVPNSLRESALALGAPRWKTTLQIVFRCARSGLLTGVLLSVARVSGETAPLLFTALNSPYWPESLNGPTPNLTVTIFNCAMSPYADWQQLAWGASFIVTAAVLALNISSRFLLKRGSGD
jgi:phosphate transport system permease protein